MNSILVVDDNPINLKLVNVLLKIEGYKVETASNAEEVMAILKTFKPHLILMDIQLPEMDGLELTRCLKADPRHQNIIILALTAYAMKGDEEKAMAAGCNGYITKPIDPLKLPVTIAKYIKEAKA